MEALNFALFMSIAKLKSLLGTPIFPDCHISERENNMWCTPVGPGFWKKISQILDIYFRKTVVHRKEYADRTIALILCIYAY